MASASAELEPAQRPKTGGLNLRVVYHAVRRHPLVLILVLILAGSAAAGVWFFLPLPKKTAAAVFHVASQGGVLATHENRIDLAPYKQAQVALLKSRRMLNDVLNQPEIRNLGIVRTADPDALTWLEKYLTVDAKAVGTEFIRVSIEGDDGDDLIVLLTALSKAYQAAAAAREHKAREIKVEGLRKSKENAQKTVDELRKEIADKGGSNPLYWLANDKYLEAAFIRAYEAHTAATQELVAAEATLKAARETAARKAVTGAILATTGGTWLGTLPDTEQHAGPGFLSAVVDDALRTDPAFRDLEAAVTQALQDQAEALPRLGEGPGADATRARLAETVKAAEKKRDDYRMEAHKKAEKQHAERAGLNDEARVLIAQREVVQLAAKEKRAMENLEKKKDDIQKAHKKKHEIEGKVDELSKKEKVASALADEYEKIMAEPLSSRVSVSEDPFLVTGIEGNRRMKFAVLAGVGMFFAGFAGLVGWEYRSRRVTHVDEVSTGVGARLLGTIPPLAEGAAARAVVVEAIDTVRTVWMHGTPRGARNRVLVVTSAVSGEGKTTVSGHFAISLTRAGFRVLLVDGDMQSPTAHDLFDLAPTPGLSELLRNEAGVDDAVRPSRVPGLSILPAGKWSLATRQALVGERWHQVKRDLLARFDFVVIDTSPLLLVSDTLMLAREADGVVVSVLVGVSQTVRVAETVERLQTVGAEVAGVVVNNVRSGVYGYPYRYPRNPEPAPEVHGANEG